MRRLACASCGELQPAEPIGAECPRCGGLLELEIDTPLRDAVALKSLFASRTAVGRGLGEAWSGDVAESGKPLPAVDRSGVWRYRELVLPDATDCVTYPEGNTPLIGRSAVSGWCGVGGLLIKHEGGNPTGSFKDRGMAVALTEARRLRASGVLCASTGNTSSSMAAYAGIAGIPALVLVPAGQVAPAKLAQTLAYGARVLSVKGGFDDCLRLAREATRSLGIYLANSVNPYRLAGQKTIVFELLDQLGWNAPDWIALPAGNLGNASAFGAALVQARDLGLIPALPRLLLVQAAGAAPFVESYRAGFEQRIRVSPLTIATAIRIGDPVSFGRAVRAVRDTNGVAASVSDSEILEAKSVIDRSGIGCEPASAAAIAGVRQLVRDGTIAQTDRVVAVLTGHLLKDIDAGGSQTQHTAVVEIEPRIADIEEALRMAT